MSGHDEFETRKSIRASRRSVKRPWNLRPRIHRDFDWGALEVVPWGKPPTWYLCGPLAFGGREAMHFPVEGLEA